MNKPTATARADTTSTLPTWTQLSKAMGVADALQQGRQVKDYNMKGSAWIARDTGQLVKFKYDTTMACANGENYSTHFEGVVTKK